jgi:hypothetical protein
MAFTTRETSILLSTPGIGPKVIQRLQEVGLDSLRNLRETGVDSAVLRVCDVVGDIGWANRRKPLRRAFQRLCEAAES